MKKQKIITITGRSGSGKTTIIEKLITHYSSSGKKISVVKSMKHEFNIDREGKDTFRYREAGVFSWAITNGNEYALLSDIDTPLTPLDIAEKHFSESEIIFIEGYKEGETRKIEVISSLEEDPLFMQDRNIIAVASDLDIDASIPHFKRDDISSIVRFIEENF